MKDLRGKVVVISGTASGIGRVLAMGLVKAGTKLALHDVDAIIRRQVEGLLNDTDSP